jgi:hypothetical protein
MSDIIDFDEIKCNYLTCFAGMGVAGMLSCSLGGEIGNPNCHKFRDEKSELLKYAEEHIDIIEKRNDELIKALLYFIKRVANGSIKSKTTNEKYIEIVERLTGKTVKTLMAAGAVESHFQLQT